MATDPSVSAPKEIPKVFTDAANTPLATKQDELLEILNTNKAAKTLFGQIVIKGALIIKFKDVFGTTEEVAHLALKKYWKFDAGIADDMAERLMSLAGKHWAMESAVYIVLVQDFRDTFAKDKKAAPKKLKNLYNGFMLPDIADSKSKWIINMEPKIRNPIMKERYGSKSLEEEGLGCETYLKEGVLGDDNECIVALDEYARICWQLLTDRCLLEFLEDKTVAQKLEEIRPDHSKKWDDKCFKAMQDISGLYSTREHAGWKASYTHSAPDPADIKPKRPKKIDAHREYSDMYYHSSFGESVGDQYDDYSKQSTPFQPHQQFNDLNHYNPLISGEYNDASGSESSLLIGGVVGASAVVIIMLIFCLGLAFGMVIYWGYSQKRSLDVKRSKDE
eukprot:839069_1